jgi:carbamate kinase
MSSTERPSILIALGGNALNVRGKEKVHQKEEFIVARRAMENVVDLVEDDHSKLVITHGNGPQVGRIFLQQELTLNEFPRQLTLEVCVADSQGRIGYILQNVFDNICAERGLEVSTSTVITQVVVDRDDPAFAHPTKPIGVFYSQEQADALMSERGWTMMEDAGRGWRRVVPSPEPVEIVERELFVQLLEMNFIAIGAGGGGIPVIRKANGELRGVEAVIDKDRTSALLARQIGIDVFVILTNVKHAYLDHNKPTQRPLHSVTLSELEGHIRDGQFHAGSMLPKVQAAMRFVEAGGQRAVIASLFDLIPALEGRAGTQILP